MAGIDKDFWLDFAKEGVANSIQNREKSAEKLDKFLEWIWSIYTSIFALASLFNFIGSNIWQLIWAAQPILVIMLARYFCTNVSLPSTNNDERFSADPNDVASIIDSYKFIVNHKKFKLKIAKLFTLIAIISLSASLVGYNYCDPNKALKQEAQIQKLKKEIGIQ
jgi:hypothetical protein